MSESTQNEDRKQQDQCDGFQDPSPEETASFRQDYLARKGGVNKSYAYALTQFIKNRRAQHVNRVKELEAEVAKLKAAPFTDTQLDWVREAVHGSVLGRSLGFMPAEQVSAAVISRLRPAPKTLEERVTIQEPNDEGYPYVVRVDGAYRKGFFGKEDAEIYRLGLIAAKLKEGSHA